MALIWPDDFINRVICGDCLEILPMIPDGVIDAVITDPPYGIGIINKSRGSIGGSKSFGSIGGAKKIIKAKVYPAVIGDDSPFNPSALLKRFYDKPMVLFGANYYARSLPEMSSWFIWDKRDGTTSDNFADCEMAWSNVGGPARLFSHHWRGLIKASEQDQRRLHPTQKPVAVMRWIIDKTTAPGQIILDPYAGSGSTLVAAKELGRNYIGIEITQDYCAIAVERLKQGELFV